MKKNAAVGVDGVTWHQYKEGLAERIAGLHERVHAGSYRAQPVRRKYIDKPDGRKRPLGVTALEDNIVRQAAATVLNQIYETDFMGFSYGFREKRSQHNALDALYIGMSRCKINYILDADMFLKDLTDRMGKFGFELHPDKTRLIEFGRFAEVNYPR